MKPRWAPRWFTYVGLGPNPALPRPVGDSAPIAFYNWIEKSVLGPPDVDQQEWPAWRKRIAARCEEAKAVGDQEMVDLCYLLLDDIAAEESER